MTAMRTPPLFSRRRPAHGMSLIEVLVGIAIGLISLLVIFQVVSVWDARTRISNAVGDAQTAGALAMFNLEQDIKLAGMGFGSAESAEMGCTVNAYDNVATAPVNFPFIPLQIIDGDATGDPDTIAVLHGNSSYFPIAEEVGLPTPSTILTDTKYGFKRGDLAVLTDNAGTCRLVQITDDTNPDSRTLTFGTGTYDDYYDGNPNKLVRWNPVSASLPSITGGKLYNLGPSPRLNEWSVDAATTRLGFINRLPVVDVNPFLGIAESVVTLKAQYGYDADGNGQIDGTEWTKTLTAPIDWTRVRAVRVALLLRSRDFARPNAASTPEAPGYIAAVPQWSAGAFDMKNLDGSTGTPASTTDDWRYYRYRVYEKVIPLRNVIWGQS